MLGVLIQFLESWYTRESTKATAAWAANSAPISTRVPPNASLVREYRFNDPKRLIGRGQRQRESALMPNSWRRR